MLCPTHEISDTLFALDACVLIRQLDREEPGPTVRKQLVKSSTSVALNYRAACRARSHDEYTAKMGLVAEEADESFGWLEFILPRSSANYPIPQFELPDYQITRLPNSPALHRSRRV
jgi:four helix bundle protein